MPDKRHSGRLGFVVQLAFYRMYSRFPTRRASAGVPFGQNAATCPVRALEVWMAAAGIVEGPLFARSIASGGWGMGLSRDTPWP